MRARDLSGVSALSQVSSTNRTSEAAPSRMRNGNHSHTIGIAGREHEDRRRAERADDRPPHADRGDQVRQQNRHREHADGMHGGGGADERLAKTPPRQIHGQQCGNQTVGQAEDRRRRDDGEARQAENPSGKQASARSLRGGSPGAVAGKALREGNHERERARIVQHQARSPRHRRRAMTQETGDPGVRGRGTALP